MQGAVCALCESFRSGLRIRMQDDEQNPPVEVVSQPVERLDGGEGYFRRIWKRDPMEKQQGFGFLDIRIRLHNVPEDGAIIFK